MFSCIVLRIFTAPRVVDLFFLSVNWEKNLEARRILSGFPLPNARLGNHLLHLWISQAFRDRGLELVEQKTWDPRGNVLRRNISISTYTWPSETRLLLTSWLAYPTSRLRKAAEQGAPRTLRATTLIT